MKFKLGDKVIVNPKSQYYRQMGNSEYGTIITVDYLWYDVEWKDGTKNGYKDEDLLLLPYNTIKELNKASNQSKINKVPSYDNIPI